MHRNFYLTLNVGIEMHVMAVLFLMLPDRVGGQGTEFDPRLELISGISGNGTLWC